MSQLHSFQNVKYNFFFFNKLHFSFESALETRFGRNTHMYQLYLLKGKKRGGLVKKTVLWDVTGMRTCTLRSVLLVWIPCKINWSQLYVFQISSSDDPKFPRGILKSPATESVVSNKQVQFLGLSSESDISLVSISTADSEHFIWFNIIDRG